jgi:hypothetical protein
MQWWKEFQVEDNGSVGLTTATTVTGKSETPVYFKNVRILCSKQKGTYYTVHNDYLRALDARMNSQN